jgi:hypothetical protein
MVTKNSNLLGEIINRQIQLQELEAMHEELLQRLIDPKSVRASKARIREVASSLERLKINAGISLAR